MITAITTFISLGFLRGRVQLGEVTPGSVYEQQGDGGLLRCGHTREVTGDGEKCLEVSCNHKVRDEILMDKDLKKVVACRVLSGN